MMPEKAIRSVVNCSRARDFHRVPIRFPGNEALTNVCFDANVFRPVDKSL
jgi:hypothetical protein